MFDILIVIFSYFLLMVFKDYDHLSDMRIADSLRELIPVLIAFVGIFIATKSYRGMLRYSGFNDIVRLIFITGLSFGVLTVGKFLLCHFFPQLLSYFPTYMGILFICIFTFMTLTSSRLLVRRIYNEYLRPHAKIVNVVNIKKEYIFFLIKRAQLAIVKGFLIISRSLCVWKEIMKEYHLK